MSFMYYFDEKAFYMAKILIMTYKTNDALWMRWIRSRTEHGPLRQKREDTHVETLEKKYWRDFGVRGDMHLWTLLEKKWQDSLNDLITGK